MPRGGRARRDGEGCVASDELVVAASSGSASILAAPGDALHLICGGATACRSEISCASGGNERRADMNRHRISGLAGAFAHLCLALGLLAPTAAHAAALTMVPRATWGASGVPSYMQMYIYVPDKLATKPPIYVSSHSCGSTATGQLGNIPLSKAAADSNGFIMILPDNPGQ